MGEMAEEYLASEMSFRKGCDEVCPDRIAQLADNGIWLTKKGEYLRIKKLPKAYLENIVTFLKMKNFDIPIKITKALQEAQQ
jgi:hypothetical protein